MKLLKKNADGTLEVVESENRLAGISDGFKVAQDLGDGEYIADFLDGSYIPFKVQQGTLAGGVDISDISYGNPYTTTAEGQRFHDRETSAYRGYIPDVVGTEDDPGSNAVDEYIPREERV